MQINKEIKLIKAIQKANSDILKLKFGCYVKLDKVYDRDEAVILKMFKDGGSCIFGMDKGINQERPEILFNRESIGEILGRNITLEDIMITLNKTDIWAIDLEGEFFKQDASCGEPIYSEVKWQLGKPLHMQSDSTKDFIGELLGIL